MNISKTISFVVLALFLISCAPESTASSTTPTAPSQRVGEPIQPVSWPMFDEDWTHFQGISYLNDQAYDPQGYLWATGRKNVYRWNIETGDLTEFTPADGLPDGVMDITVFEGKVWVTAAHGLISYHSDGKWRAQTLSSGDVYDFSDTGDRLWVTASDGLYYLEGREWKHFDLMPEEFEGEYFYYSVARFRDGSLWFWRSDRVLRFDGDQWQEYPSLSGLREAVSLSDGRLLFIFSDLIVTFDGNELSPLAMPDGRFRYSIRNSFLTPDGDLRLELYSPSTAPKIEGYQTYLIHNGRLNETTPVVFRNPPEESLYTPRVLTPQGWVFNTSKELYLYHDNRWKKFGFEKPSPIIEMMGNTVIGFGPDGVLWAKPADAPPVSYDGKKMESYIEEDACSSYSFWKWLINSKGDVFGGASMTNRLCHYDTVTGRSSLIELFFTINDFALSQDGSVWAASDGGFIVKLTEDYLNSRDYRDLEMIQIGDGLVRRPVKPTRIEVTSDGAVWVFARNVGLYRYDGQEWKYYGLHTLQDPSAFAVDSKGQVWAGFPGKLVKFDGEKWTSYPFACLCPSKLIIAPDEAVWFVHGCDGVYRFDEKEWTHFTGKDLGGFVPDRILVAPDGALWFIGYQNASRYKP